jgi:hypothetical protein
MQENIHWRDCIHVSTANGEAAKELSMEVGLQYNTHSIHPHIISQLSLKVIPLPKIQAIQSSNQKQILHPISKWFKYANQGSKT